MRFDLQRGFPLITTKKVHTKAVIHELLWFIRGETNIGYLKENGVRIWDEWADEQGNLGPVYGKQWRAWSGPDGRVVDQLQQVIGEIRVNKDSRRLVVSSWNPGEIDRMALPPCHCLFQFSVLGGRLNCQLYQRSADLFLGVPFNIASYALLTAMIAQVVELEVGEFVHTFGDMHIYANHFEQVQLQLSRQSRPMPTLKLNENIFDISGFCYEDIEIENYDPHPRIAAPVAV